MMTRSEAKAVLIAWKEADYRIKSACRRKGVLVQKLKTLPELSGSAAVNITVAGTDRFGNPVKEPGFAYLPHGSGTGDPTARVADKRLEYQAEIDALTQEVSALEVFYWEVLRAVCSLPVAHARLLHLHYCTRDPGYSTPKGKKDYFDRLRDAVSAFQSMSPIPIPDDLNKDKDVIGNADL